MGDYIEREALRDALYEQDAITMRGVAIINNFPAADVAPVRHGRWIPVSEKLPDVSENVLVWDDASGDVFTGWYNDGWEIDGFSECNYHWNITHWMPMPKPPEEEK